MPTSEIYLARLSSESQQGILQSLNIIANILSADQDKCIPRCTGRPMAQVRRSPTWARSLVATRCSGDLVQPTGDLPPDLDHASQGLPEPPRVVEILGAEALQVHPAAVFLASDFAAEFPGVSVVGWLIFDGVPLYLLECTESNQLQGGDTMFGTDAGLSQAGRPMSSRRTTRRNDSPATIYLSGLAEGSQLGMRQALKLIANYLSDDQQDADSFPWQDVRFGDTAAVRSMLADRYAPATTNKMLAALRGVMRATWRLGLIDYDTYQRAIDIENLRATTLPKGRALAPEEISALFQVCADDPSPAGRRDAAMLAVFYGAGLRRSEVAGLDLADFDDDECSITIRNGKQRKQRTVYLTGEGCELVREWIRERGDEDGALFTPVSQTGNVRIKRMKGESLSYVLRQRQQKAEVDPFSPHDLRRSNISQMLENGVDVFTVQRLAGHADPTTTRMYDKRGEQTKRSAAQSLRLTVVNPHLDTR